MKFAGRSDKRIVCFAVLFFFSMCAFSQKKSQIKFQADNIEYDEKLGNKARRLINNVIFEHKGAFMYCDSAWHYPEINSLDAFGRVKMVQGDSLELFCDFLHYDGEKELFTCKKNVVLDNKEINLSTDHLIYNRLEEFGYYSNGGKIVNRKEGSTLTSARGHYYTKINDFYFRENVVYTHPDFIIEADTLKHNSESKVTNFLGPTKIFSGDDRILCERGFFDSFRGLSKYHQNARVYSGTREISGDTIFFDKTASLGRVTGNANIYDTAENVSILGQLALIFEDRDSAEVTVVPELQQYFTDDTLFLHADTFKVFRKNGDSSRILQAYPEVRFFKKDLQGKCDSIIYSFEDSSIKMFTKPVLWTGENQITGEFMQLNTANGQLHSLDVNRNSFVVSLVDPSKYNQIRGKDMKGFFAENELDELFVTGNGQTIYYARDEEDRFIGVNRGESSNLKIKLVENEISEIAYINDGNATFYPLGELTSEELKLRGFTWQVAARPKDRADIFRQNE